MLYLLFIAVPLVLLVAFLSLTVVETRRGVRVFASARAALDTRASRLGFIVKHVDLGAFSWHLLRDGTAHFIHFVAHTALSLVRFAERSLTRLVKGLRTRYLSSAAVRTTPAVSRSAFVETMAYFKHTLRRSRQAPPAPEAETTPAVEQQ